MANRTAICVVIIMQLTITTLRQIEPACDGTAFCAMRPLDLADEVPAEQTSLRAAEIRQEAISPGIIWLTGKIAIGCT